MTAFTGSMAGGSLLWGQLADQTSIAQSLTFAALGLAMAIVFTFRWRISGFEEASLSPSMHWPTPQVHDGVHDERGPVMVTLRYDVQPSRRAAFLELMGTLGGRRRRDGAFAWGLFEDTEVRDRFLESFYVESWLDHLRQHERVTDDDRLLQEEIAALLVEGAKPQVSHFVAPESPSRRDRSSLREE